MSYRSGRSKFNTQGQGCETKHTRSAEECDIYTYESINIVFKRRALLSLPLHPSTTCVLGTGRMDMPWKFPQSPHQPQVEQKYPNNNDDDDGDKN